MAPGQFISIDSGDPANGSVVSRLAATDIEPIPEVSLVTNKEWPAPGMLRDIRGFHQAVVSPHLNVAPLVKRKR